jgi:hypothetical protein
MAARELGMPRLKRTAAGRGRQAPEGSGSGIRLGSDVAAQLRGPAMDELEQSGGLASDVQRSYKTREEGA